MGSKPKSKTIYMPTHKGMMAKGMPARSPMRMISAAVEEANPVHLTRHKRTTNRPHANKARQQTQREAHAGIACNVLPQDGGNKKHTRPLDPSEHAGFFGYKHQSSFSRAFSQRRHNLIACERKNGRRQMEWRLPEIARPNYDEDAFQPATPRDMKQIHGMEALYDDCATATLYRKFAEAIFQPACPLTMAQRAVLAYLVEHELFLYNLAADRWNSGRVRVSQARLCHDTGYSVDAVRGALRELAQRGIIKIVRTRCTGSKHVSHDYVGICDWAESEKQRYDRSMAAIRATGDKWRLVMDRIHSETMCDWLDDGRQQKTFHAEFKKRLEEAGVPPDRVGQVIPSLG